jgi:type 1 glutamine amidotransferase
MSWEGKTMRERAATALVPALVFLGSFSTGALGVDTHSHIREFQDPNDPKISGDFDYGVCRGTDPKCYSGWIADRNNKVLIYTRTAGPRHANLGPALAPGLNPPLTPAHVVQNALVKWLAEQGVAADWTEDVNTLASTIGPSSRYNAVIFASTSRDALWKHGTAVNPTRALDTTTGAHLDAGKTALRQFVRNGGGFVGIHNAFGTEYNWPYYEGLLGNANYYDHGQFQDGTVNIVARDASTNGLPASFPFKDEWYNLRPFPTQVKFLATVDEDSLATKRTTHPGHGKFHPIAWCQYYDGGRVWVTTLGHDRDAFTDGSTFPSQAQFKQLIVNGILSAMGNKPFCE